MDTQNMNVEPTRTFVAFTCDKMRYVMTLLAFVAVTLTYTFKSLPLLYYYDQSISGMFVELVEFLAFSQFTIPISIIAERFSAKSIMCAAFIFNTASLLLVLSQRSHLGIIIFWRIVQGFTEATYFPVIHLLIARWAPPNERTFMASIIWSGIPISQLIALEGGPLILPQSVDMTVALAVWTLVWVACWLMFVENFPERPGRFTSQKERQYILASQNKPDLGFISSYPPFPFKDVLASKPFWAILLCHLCIECGLTVLHYVPLHKSPDTLGYFQQVDLSWVPIFLQLFFTLFMGFAMMMILKTGRVDITTARKIATTFAIIPGIMVIIIMYTNEPIFLFFLYSTGVMFSGAIYSGYMINHIDIAPKFAATLFAGTMTVVNVARLILTYILVDYIINKQDWNTYGASLVTGLGLFSVNAVLCYWIFGSGREQPWNDDKKRQGKIKNEAYEYSQTPYPDHV